MESIEFEARSERLEGGTVLISVRGELDLYTVPQLERTLRDADGAGPVVIELSECTFIDSTALGVLVEASRRLYGEAPLSIVASSPDIQRPFELTGLDREFNFHSSLDSALERSVSMSGLHAKEARSQALFREVNERVKQLADTLGGEQDSFICECGNPECTQPIALTSAEYDRIREHGNRFAIALDHENPETETLVEQNERFAVVETFAGEASQIARETDPRSQARQRASALDGGAG
jgi:anti-sigma B factor antagonist